ncbi:TauD/TfdA family dioxygenase [Providencia sp. wls1950]|uniref:TauD/TfdA family dioxygenase n=1 Tax=Providencia sp. wls1950 TaxID=2675147 RepID=UPI0012B64AE7|nr:TauD/TfdA family dioxygenase [Providencia sp. wls1950]MTB46799.1 taurine catabolism dioxygenase TauD [Providencia sp. wls1950]
MTFIKRNNKFPFDFSFDVSKVQINIDSLINISFDKLNALVDCLNQYGFTIVDFGENKIQLDEFLHLKFLFGNPKSHPRADFNGVVPINSFNPLKGHLDSTNSEHLLHTDGSFSSSPGNILALQCNIASKVGGLSIIASAQAAYIHIKEKFPDTYHLVHSKDAIEIKRNSQKTLAPIYNLHNGRSKIRFRFPDGAAEITPSEEVAPIYKELCEFFKNNNNVVTFQLHNNQMLIADNGSIVHGRTKYPESELRDLRRLNLDGNGILNGKVQYGIKLD